MSSPRAADLPARLLPLANRAFGRLWAARSLSAGGDGFTIVAFMIYATTVSKSGVTMGIILVAEIVSSFLSPVLGLLADRMDRRRLMIFAELVQAAVMAALAIWLPPLPVIVALAFVRSLMATLVRTSAGSCVPGYVDSAGLPAANAWLRGGEEGANIIGPMLAGVLAPLFGLRVLFVIDGVSFLIAALLLVGLHPQLSPAADKSPDEAPEDAGLLGGSWAGLRYVWRHPVARAISIGLFLFVAFAALENVPRPFLAQRDFHAGAFGIGLLFAMPQLGMVIGLAGMSRFGTGYGLRATLFVGMMLYGLGSFATAAAPSLWLAGFAQLVSGIGNGVEVGIVDTMLQRTVARAMLGRVLANVYGGASIAAGLAYTVGGPLLDATSARTLFVVVGAGCVVAAVVTTSLLPKGPLDREPPPR